MTVSRSSPAATLLPDGRVLVTGGDSASTELYERDLGSRRAAATMAARRVQHTASLLADGDVLVVGGVSSTTAVYAERWNHVADRFDSVAEPPVRRQGHWAVTLQDGSVLIGGGVGPSGEAVQVTHRWVNGTWTSSALSGQGRFMSAVRLDDGRVLAVGGQIGTVNPTPSAAAAIYTPSTRLWSVLPSMNTGRMAPVLVKLSTGAVLVVGGYANNGIPVRSAEIIDPQAMQFMPVAAPPDVWIQGAGAALPDGSALFFGPSSTMARYRAGSWSPESPGPGLISPAIVQPGATSIAAFGSGSLVALWAAACGDVSGCACSDGYCCDAECSGGCNRCDLPGLRGRCTTQAAGTIAPGGVCGPYLCEGLGTCDSCASNATCLGGTLCDLAKCVSPKVLGQACGRDGACVSGRCVDGVCCNAACAGPCDSCTQAGHLGECLLEPARKAGTCGLHTCSGTTTECASSCLANEDCAPAGHCRDHACVPLEPLGTACAVDRDCATGHCVDGVCCDSACGACGHCGGDGLCRIVAAGLPGSPACAPYLCDGAALGCPASCVTVADCASGHVCVSNRCAVPLANGVACTLAAQCASGVCVDGVCCESSCGSACGTCANPDRPGRCVARPVRSAPRAGAGCELWSCDGASAACPTTCASDADCADEAWCSSGTCLAKRVRGAACSEARECASASCVDGVCCDAECSGACETCTAGRTVGVCEVLPDGAAARAGRCGPMLCDGTRRHCPGSCASDRDCASDAWCSGSACLSKAPTGDACNDPRSCLSGHCADRTCCENACPDVCARCDLPMTAGLCRSAPARSSPRDASCGAALCDGVSATCAAGCASDLDCVSGSWCSANGCAAKGIDGQRCTSDRECGSGFCVDGVCCESGCDGQCARCDGPGTAGHCTAVLGAPRNGRPACASDGSNCAGSCDGQARGACRYRPVGTACGGASCTGGEFQDTASCDGFGACVKPSPQACDPYPCRSGACGRACVDDRDCAASFHCESGRCVGARGPGEPCRSDAACASGSCADGVCCDVACRGGCERCDAPEHVGTCVPDVEDHGACAPLRCRAGEGSCPSTCARPEDCLPGFLCAEGACRPEVALGEACARGTECASGVCSEGVCCDRACEGECESCRRPGLVGQCGTLSGETRNGLACPGIGACAAKCDGAHAICTYPAGPVPCGPAFCSQGVETAASMCVEGACVAGESRACGPEGCEGVACAPAAPEGCASAGAASGFAVVGLVFRARARRRRA